MEVTKGLQGPLGEATVCPRGEGFTKVIHGSERGLWYFQGSELPKNQNLP